MSAQGPHIVTAMFEEAIARYTGAPYVVAVDNATNGLALCLLHENVQGLEIEIPNRTYMSVPCEILFAGACVRWSMLPDEARGIRGAYRLAPTRIWDSALRFTTGMYLPGSLMVLSFTGAYKHLKLGKGGAILTDEKETWEWLKRARNSGRNECSYHVDNFTQLGRNCYMMPSVAALGLVLINQCYELDGTPKSFADLYLPYPDLSKFPVYSK